MEGRRYTKVQTERVLHEIVARGLLSLQELRVCSYVWAHSWGFDRQDTGPNKVTGAAIGKWCGMRERNVRQTKADLIGRGILIAHESGALEFNEHIDTWAALIEPERAALIEPERAALIEPVESGPNRAGPNRAARPKQGRSPALIEPPSGPNRAVPYIEDKELLTKNKNKNKNKSKSVSKTRAPTAVEKVFIDGFQKCYGHTPEIGKPHAIRLNELTAKHGHELVQAKIVAWWQSPAGQWCKGNRTIGAFLHAFDQITVGVNPHDGIAVARAILAQRRERGGNGGRGSSGSTRDQLPGPVGRQDNPFLDRAMPEAETISGADR